MAKKKTGGRRGEMARQPDGGNRSGVTRRQQRVANTPRRSEVKDWHRKAKLYDEGKSGSSGETTVKEHTRKGKKVAEHKRKTKGKGSGESSSSGRSSAQSSPNKSAVGAQGAKLKAQVRAGRTRLTTGRSLKGAQADRADRKLLAGEARKFVKSPVSKARNTKDHAKAGLHRVGKSGNNYTDASGRTFHRGKGGTFKLGASKAGAKALKGRAKDKKDAGLKGKKLPGSKLLKPRKIKAGVKTVKTRRRGR